MYTEADLEPVRSALAALRDGDLRPRRFAPASPNGTSGLLAEITALVDDVGGQLALHAAEVTQMAAQVRDIAQVATAVAKGDLSQKITVDAQGQMLQLKQTMNTMVDQLSAFADEVTRVAREVGTEGNLGGQAHVRGASGVWKDLTDSVNGMASNLTVQVRGIAQVATAVAKGDLSQKITVDAQGEILQLKDTINTMVDQLSAFADEVTRVAREVGTEGNLGGQAHVRGASGVWKDLTDSVNGMASNLTVQVRGIAQVTTAVANGDLSKKITVDAQGEILQLKDTINTMVDQLSAFADEVTRMAREVGTEGRLGGQAHVRGVSGTWKDLTDNVNSMADNLTSQVRNIAQVTTAVANGDLSKKITVDAQGEILQLKDTINTMVDQLSAFADEVTRMAREVGTEGRLGGQAHVRGVSGTWKDLTDNVNSMANNLTGQVRGIAQVATAVAGGDLSKKITVDARGEILELKTTINTMVDQLSAFADEVTRVAREVGSEGRLGGQAQVRRHLRNLEGPDGERQRARRQPHHPGARDRRGGQRRRGGRPDPVDPGRRPRRGRRTQGQHQPDGRQPARDDERQPGAGLAEDQPGPDRRPHAGPPRPARPRPRDHERADPADLGPVRRVLPGRGPGRCQRDGGGADPQADRRLRVPQEGPARIRLRRRAGRPGRGGAQANPDHPCAHRVHHGRLRPRRGRARPASRCCPSCSRTRCSACSSLPRCTSSATRTWPSSISSSARSA